jgi:UDP-N-acetylmuramate dehydrogenase
MDMSQGPTAQPTLRGSLRQDESMARHVTWRAGGRARITFQPVDVADLSAFLRTLAPGMPVLFTGLGSNLLVRDGGFEGAFVFTHHALTGIETGLQPRTFLAAAGVPAPHVARFVAKHGGGGAEWMAGVPGTVGGALAMNAGCYGGETWNHVTSVETIDRDGTLRRREPSEYEVGYRHVRLRAGAGGSPLEDGIDGGSPLGDRVENEWFVAAHFAFEQGDEKASMARMRELLAKRVATQPLSQPNAGSVFRNPPGDHAARLIESCGLKGHTIGRAQVSPKHANFIVNLGGASAADIERLIDHVQATVESRTGLALVREVRIVGKNHE